MRYGDGDLLQRLRKIVETECAFGTFNPLRGRMQMEDGLDPAATWHHAGAGREDASVVEGPARAEEMSTVLC